ncbi:MAG: Fe2+-dependent dioxygenase [Burkholderiaceae bacterium]|jgi:PKHD-type hydroxylase|nr:Fe2+-dependent dioxygenase [Burkholderiaceae bacterium]
MLVTFDDILTADELAAVRSQLSRAPWSTGLSAGPQAMLAKKNQQLPEDYAGLPDLRRLVMRALNRSPLLLSAALPHKVVPPNFNRYTPEHSHYGWHTDSTLRYLPDGSVLRTDISATLFLSDPEAYEGGELCIEDTYGQHPVKLSAGSLVIYPSGSIHEVRPVTHGERLACYLFMQSAVKDTECRRQLYEMDQALMDLRQRCGEGDPALVRLTGLYNNLVRRWSEC